MRQMDMAMMFEMDVANVPNPVSMPPSLAGAMQAMSAIRIQESGY